MGGLPKTDFDKINNKLHKIVRYDNKYDYGGVDPPPSLFDWEYINKWASAGNKSKENIERNYISMVCFILENIGHYGDSYKAGDVIYDPYSHTPRVCLDVGLIREADGKKITISIYPSRMLIEYCNQVKFMATANEPRLKYELSTLLPEMFKIFNGV